MLRQEKEHVNKILRYQDKGQQYLTAAVAGLAFSFFNFLFNFFYSSHVRTFLGAEDPDASLVGSLAYGGGGSSGDDVDASRVTLGILDTLLGYSAGDGGGDGD